MQKISYIAGRVEKNYRASSMAVKVPNIVWLMLISLAFAFMPNVSLAKSAPPPMVPASFSDIADQARALLLIYAPQKT